MNASSASVLSHPVVAPGQPLVTSRSYACPFLLLFKLQLSPSAKWADALQGLPLGWGFVLRASGPHTLDLDEDCLRRVGRRMVSLGAASGLACPPPRVVVSSLRLGKEELAVCLALAPKRDS